MDVEIVDANLDNDAHCAGLIKSLDEPTSGER
jgi:hypothetical protein